MTDPWADLRAEVRAFEEWYQAPVGVNAWVGVDSTNHGFYGGWAVNGDTLFYDWDDSVMMTARGDTPEAVIADLIRIARKYRARVDADNAEATDD